MVYVAYWFGCVTPVKYKSFKTVDEALAFGADIIFERNGYIDWITEEEYNKLSE